MSLHVLLISEKMYRLWTFLLMSVIVCLHATQAEGSCEKCQDWYNSERFDTNWLIDVNRRYPCPCSVKVGWFSLTPNDQPKNKWTRDWACITKGHPLCSKFHPGATGCLRSAQNSPYYGARQQCCYGKDGRLLPPDHAGAGTPDRSGSLFKHQRVDVWPYEWCCKDCSSRTHCDYYKILRKGDNSHC